MEIGLENGSQEHNLICATLVITSEKALCFLILDIYKYFLDSLYVCVILWKINLLVLPYIFYLSLTNQITLVDLIIEFKKWKITAVLQIEML